MRTGPRSSLRLSCSKIFFRTSTRRPSFVQPGGLRIAIARALGTLDLPPFASLEEFRAAIARFAATDLPTVARDLFLAGRARSRRVEAHRLRLSPPVEPLPTTRFTISDVRACTAGDRSLAGRGLVSQPHPGRAPARARVGLFEELAGRPVRTHQLGALRASRRPRRGARHPGRPADDRRGVRGTRRPDDGSRPGGAAYRGADSRGAGRASRPTPRVWPTLSNPSSRTCSRHPWSSRFRSRRSNSHGCADPLPTAVGPGGRRESRSRLLSRPRRYSRWPSFPPSGSTSAMLPPRPSRPLRPPCLRRSCRARHP